MTHSSGIGVSAHSISICRQLSSIGNIDFLHVPHLYVPCLCAAVKHAVWRAWPHGRVYAASLEWCKFSQQTGQSCFNRSAMHTCEPSLRELNGKQLPQTSQ